MKYSESVYKELSKRFNEKSFLGKIMLVKQTPELFQLEVDEYSNFFLRLNDDDAQFAGIDKWFDFPQNLSAKDFKSLFSMIDINLKMI